jgi:peptidyl-tRNA hydrolase
MKIKMYCIFARESIEKMNGIRGKMATQAGHAYLHAFWNACEIYDPELTNHKRDQAIDYKNSSHAYKITLIVDTVEELKALQESYKDVCGVSLVTDAGFTVFTEPTTTCLGLGPIREDRIKDDLKSLKTFS